MSVEELITESKSLRKAGRYQDAVRLVRSATELDPKNPDAWWQLGLNLLSDDKAGEAVGAFRETVRLAPQFATGWAYFGWSLWKTNAHEPAIKAFKLALEKEPNHESALRWLANAYQHLKQPDEQLDALLALEAAGKASDWDLNQIGILFHNRKNYGAAQAYYRQAALGSEAAVAGWFNLGLVCNEREVSQDVDAVDAWRMVLRRKPDHERAPQSLARVTQRLTDLARDAKALGPTLVEPRDQFQHYVNPFELLAAPVDADAKTLQRLKKALLQELELEDGKVSWLDGHVFDRSRVLALCEELNDGALREHHRRVFENKSLLRFLTRGEHAHFLYHPTESPLETIEDLGRDANFRAWLSEPFAKQYDVVLGCALERKALPVVEALFDGRRWTLPEHDDICFASANRHVARLLEPLQHLADSAKATPPSLGQVKLTIEGDSLVGILNLLPTHFRDVQSAAVDLVRGIAISCHNIHGDSELSKSVLSCSKQFAFKNAELAQRLTEDFKTIDGIVTEETKHAFSAVVRSDAILEITKKGIRYRGRVMSATDIESIRWGVFIQRTNGIKTSHDFTMVFRGQHDIIDVSWGARGVLGLAKGLFRDKNAIVPIADQSSDEQEVHFGKMIDAVIHFVAPSLLGKLIERAKSGRTYTIGPCTVSAQGLSFKTGFIFSTVQQLPWRDIHTQIVNGSVHVMSRTNRKANTSMALKDVENAVLLPLLCSAMAES